MNLSQAAEILTLAAAFDQRTISREDAKAWALALDGLDPARCGEAVVEHYRNETARIMPAHVRAIVTSPMVRHAEREAWERKYGPAAHLAGESEAEYAERARRRNLTAIEGGAE